MDFRELRDDPAAWAILEARAQALAQQQAVAETAVGEQILTFQLGEGRYAVAARLVREVHLLAGYTPLPGTPPFVLGLVNLRGRLLTALDLRPLLQLPVSPPRAGAALLIASASGLEVGLLADQVLEIRHGGAGLAPSLAATEGQLMAWVRGIDRDLTTLIDLSLLLADPRLTVGAAS